MGRINGSQQISFLDILSTDFEDNIEEKNIIMSEDKSLSILSKESFSADKLPDEIKKLIIDLKDINTELWQLNPRIRWMWCRKCHMYYQSSSKNDIGCRGVCHSCRTK